ncbi:conjugal transfer protein [Mycoplasma mycoides]|uniref:conjugal transfer protein n=1 Tax=Mycoplasma mycoides TaxID=2102 RepID=UPI00223F699B|nr:conjugal transfer protein [Mycoplasma mycoides]QVJ96681.1 conjugal transfer protein [Mycoplasma mycoides subsp. capri]
MIKTIAIIVICFAVIIASMSLFLLATSYKDCFSKNKVTKKKARYLYKKEWITTLLITITPIWLGLSMIGVLVNPNM